MAGSGEQEDDLGPLALHWPYRIGYALVAAIILAVIVLVPVALVDLTHQILYPPSDRTVVLVPKGTLAADSYSALHLDEIALDEAQRTLRVRVSGYRVCRAICPGQDAVIFFSVHAESRLAAGLPPAAVVTLPSTTAPVDATISLPVNGELLLYPFDRHRFELAIALEQTIPGQPPRILSPAEAAGHLFVTAQERIPRLNFTTLPSAATDRLPVAGGFVFLGVSSEALYRPLYLRILVVLAVLLMTVAALCTVLMQPLKVLIINTGGLILGVWGIRALLLGNYPADVTVVDIALTAIIFVQLTAVTGRVLTYLRYRGALHFLPLAGTLHQTAPTGARPDASMEPEPSAKTRRAECSQRDSTLKC